MSFEHNVWSILIVCNLPQIVLGAFFGFKYSHPPVGSMLLFPVLGALLLSFIFGLITGVYSVETVQGLWIAGLISGFVPAVGFALLIWHACDTRRRGLWG